MGMRRWNVLLLALALSCKRSSTAIMADDAAPRPQLDARPTGPTTTTVSEWQELAPLVVQCIDRASHHDYMVTVTIGTGGAIHVDRVCPPRLEECLRHALGSVTFDGDPHGSVHEIAMTWRTFQMATLHPERDPPPVIGEELRVRSWTRIVADEHVDGDPLPEVLFLESPCK